MESLDLACDFVDLLPGSSAVSLDVIWISNPVRIAELSEENIRLVYMGRNPAQTRSRAVEAVIHIQQCCPVLPNGKPGIQLPMTATEQSGVTHLYPLFRWHLLSRESQGFTDVDETPIFCLVKQYRDLLPIFRWNFPKVGRTEVIWMFVAEPDVRDVVKVFVRELARGEQVPTVVERRSFQPRIANKSAAS